MRRIIDLLAGLLCRVEAGHPLLARCADAGRGVIPEAHRLRPGLHPAVDQGDQADPVQRRLLVDPRSDDLQQCRVDVECVAGDIRNSRRADAGGPFEDAGGAQAALVTLALVASTAGRADPGQATVVAAIPQDRILVNTDCPQFLSELAECAVHRDRKSTRLNSSHGYISYAVL